MFDVYKEKITINDTAYELIPLKGAYLPKLYELASVFSGSEDEIMDKLDEKTMATVHELALETFKTSYPHMATPDKIEELDRFVSQNLLEIMPVLVSVNMKQK